MNLKCLQDKTVNTFFSYSINLLMTILVINVQSLPIKIEHFNYF